MSFGMKYVYTLVPKKPFAYLKQLCLEQLEQPNNNTSILTTCNVKITAEYRKVFKREVRKRVMEEDRQMVMRIVLSTILAVGGLFMVVCFLSSFFIV